MSFNSVDLSADFTREKIANSMATSIANCMEEIWDFMQKEMTKLQAKQTIAANHHCKKPSAYKIGNMVWLSTRNIKTDRPSKKLNHKMIGPYKVKELVGLSYWLELPYTMKIHDIFHSNLLQKAADNPLPGQCNSPLPSTVMNDKKKWDVNNILDAKHGRGKKVIFWMKWKGYDDDRTWYNAANFDYAQNIVDDFYKQNPTKPQLATTCWLNDWLDWYRW